MRWTIYAAPPCSAVTRLLPLALALLLLPCVPTARSAGVEDVDWDSLPVTMHSALQAVDANGVRTFPIDVFPVRLRGILLNNPEDMLDSTPFSPHGVPFSLGASWQVFVQAVDPADYGGTAVFMGQHYGNVPPNLEFLPAPTVDPTRSYTDAAWLAEMERVNRDRATGHVFRAGDLVEIRGQGALYFGGKTNINEEHFIESELDFELALITPGYGLPTPTSLYLADLWDEVAGAVLFDQTRLAGGERYQGELVELLDVRLVDNGAAWAPGALLQVEDADGRTFNMRLGLRDEFASFEVPQGFFNVTGIFNQESGGPAGPGTGGYEVWVMSASDIAAVPEPSTWQLMALAATSLLALRVRRRGLARCGLAAGSVSSLDPPAERS